MLLEGAPFHKFLFLSSLLSSPLVPFPPLSLVLLLYHSHCFATGSFSRSPRALPAVCLPGERKPLPALVCSTHLHAWGRDRRAECPLQPGCTRITPPCDLGGILASVPHAAAITSTAPGSRCPCVRAAAPHKKKQNKT